MTPVLIFDGDCGFCTTSARFLERRVAGGRAGFVVVPWQRADLPALHLTEEQCTAAVQWVGPDGEIRSGAAAISAVLRAGRMPWRPVGGILQLPGIRGLAEVGYRLVAAHRYQLPGGTPACRLPSTS